MKILCLHPAVSMRTIRQMKVLKKRGHEIHLRYIGYGASAKKVDDAMIWDTKEPLFTKTYKWSHFTRTLLPQIYRKLIQWAERNSFDIIHSVSMSDVLGASAARYTMKVPTVFDVRELVLSYDEGSLITNYLPPTFRRFPRLYQRMGSFFIRRLTYLEKTAIERSKGRVFVSDYALHLAKERYNFNNDTTIILYNYVPIDEYPKKTLEKLSSKDGEIHIAYSSGLSMSGYRSKVPSFLKKLASKKIHVHIHGVFDNEYTERVYKNLAKKPYIHLEDVYPPKQLIEILTRYDYGLIYYPSEIDSLMLHTSLPNKFFEYLAAGLPIIASPYMSMKKFIEKYNVGITFTDIHDLYYKILNDKIEIKNPERFSLENHIQKLERLYFKITNP